MMSSTRSAPRPSVSSRVRVDEVLGAVVDARVGAERDAAGELFRAARGDKDRQPCRRASCHCRCPDTAPAAVDQHRLAVLQPSACKERVVRGDEDLGDAARMDQVDVVWNAHDLGCADRHELRVSATFDQEHDAVTGGRRRHAEGRTRNYARRFETEDLARARRRWVEALALEQIGTVDARTGDADHDLTVTGDRVGTLLDVQLLGPAGCGNDDRAQRSAAPRVSRGGGRDVLAGQGGEADRSGPDGTEAGGVRESRERQLPVTLTIRV